MTFPSRHAPIDQRLDALADLLQQLPIEFDGVALNKTIVNDLRDAALILRTHRNCPQPDTPKLKPKWANLNAGHT